MTYLQLVQKLVREIGIAGGGDNNPPAVTDQTGELKNIIEWVADSEEQINNNHLDWKYLWSEYSEALGLTQDPTTPSSPRARAWRTDSFWLDRFTATQRQLKYLRWSRFRQIVSTPTEPHHITAKPNGILRLDAPLTAAATLTAEYYQAPTRLTGNNDVSPIPVEYHRVILCRAAVIYGGREDAPEIVHQYETEYTEILHNLEADQLEHREAEGDPDAYSDVEQCIPGFELEGGLFDVRGY